MAGNLSQHALEIGADGKQTGFSERTHHGDVTSSRQMGVITREDVKEKLARAHGFEVVLTHNGTEVKLLDAIERLGKLIEEIGKALTDIKNIFNSAPQLGWKFTFDVSVFSGTIVVEWFPEYVPGVQANGRYMAVDWKLQGTISIEVFNISVSASFGIDARAAGSGIVVKIEGTLNGSAGVEAEINLNLFKARQQIDVKSEANAELKIIGHASIFGKTIADAELKGSGGIELVDGKLDIRWDKRTCDLTGSLESKPVIITGYIRGWIWDTELDPIEVMERKKLYAFK
jgi:hypothetical protein